MAGFFHLEPPPPATGRWLRESYNHIRQAFQGKVDDTTSITLTANVATTTVSDDRIGTASHLFFSAKTATAAAEGDNIWTKSTTRGSAVLVHSNTADVDKTFSMMIRG